MSCSYYAHFVIGVKFNKNDLVKKMPNPLYGKFKFDPETGKKIEKYTNDESILDYVSEFLEKGEDKTTIEIYDESGNVFYGRVTTAHDCESVKIVNNHIDCLPKDYAAFIYFLNENKIPYEEGCFLISNVSW